MYMCNIISVPIFSKHFSVLKNVENSCFSLLYHLDPYLEVVTRSAKKGEKYILNFPVHIFFLNQKLWKWFVAFSLDWFLPDSFPYSSNQNAVQQKNRVLHQMHT